MHDRLGRRLGARGEDQLRDGFGSSGPELPGGAVEQVAEARIAGAGAVVDDDVRRSETRRVADLIDELAVVEVAVLAPA